METFVVRVWLPDRPGALGQVASRIGSVRGDVVGIDILERGGGLAVDELVVGMPDGSSVDLLVSEIMGARLPIRGWWRQTRCNAARAAKVRSTSSTTC